ncbi:DUF86 domain-containing protein [Rhodobacteraceae bacterium CCMM004]|nr:DUF86 domain-containing protein [Rhodobacteraceae bacterium CCMM004]
MARDVAACIDDKLAAMDGVVRAHADADLDPWIRRSAIKRGFEVLSEASLHIPDELKATEHGIAWRQIAGIGNILRHDYDGTDLGILTEAIARRFPHVRAAPLRIRKRLGG